MQVMPSEAVSQGPIPAPEPDPSSQHGMETADTEREQSEGATGEGGGGGGRGGRGNFGVRREGESGDQSRDIPVVPPSQEETDQPTLPDDEV